MCRKIFTALMSAAILLFFFPAIQLSGAMAATPPKPAAPAKLIFIHHSTGQAWLGDGHGNLGITLRDNNYFTSDTNYGWGPDSIGSNTDIGNW